MNKKKLNLYIERAVSVLYDDKHCKIVQKKKCTKKYRQQIASFGNDVTMGSLKAAALFYTEQGSAAVDRSQLLVAMNAIVNYGTDQQWLQAKVVAGNIASHYSPELEHQYLNAALALKYALNLFISQDEE